MAESVWSRGTRSAVAAALLAVPLAGLEPARPRAEDGSAEAIVHRIRRELARGSVRLDPAPERRPAQEPRPGWDALAVIGPYTPVSALPAPLAGDARLRATGIETRDDVAVLAVLRQGRLVSLAVLPRGVLDLSPLAGQTLRPGQCLAVERSTPPRAGAITGCD